MPGKYKYKDPKLARKFEDRVKGRQDIHLKLYPRTHREFRKFLFDMNLSMQEAFEEYVLQLLNGNNYLINMLNKYRVRKENKEAKLLTDTDAQSALDLIEKSDPFSQEENEDEDI